MVETPRKVEGENVEVINEQSEIDKVEDKKQELEGNSNDLK